MWLSRRSQEMHTIVTGGMVLGKQLLLILGTASQLFRLNMLLGSSGIGIMGFGRGTTGPGPVSLAVGRVFGTIC